MKNKLYILVAALIATVLSTTVASAQGTHVFPRKNGVQLYYDHYNSKSKVDATVMMEIRNSVGDFNNGGLDVVFFCKDSDGKPYFKGDNEYILKISRIDGQTHILMEDMARTLKVTDLISAGDVSSICVPMTVGSSLPDTRIYTKLGPFNATLDISEKKVLGRKNITVAGRVFDCYLVHEKILTKTPFSTSTDTAETWYAEGVGGISQEVYDSKGRLKGKLILTAVR